MGPRREPQWPPGVVGSITHGSGYRAAAVADALSVLAIGVDAERDQPLPAELGGLALTDADRAASARLPRFRSWDRVAFSARESVFKAWFGVTGRWLGFPDVTLSLQPDGRHGGHFTATVGADVAGVRELVQACGTTVLTGCFQWAPGLVLTAVTLRHAAGGRPPVAPSSRPSPWVKPS
jgi:4'-phosphopantetheinyl transferase EntD